MRLPQWLSLYKETISQERSYLGVLVALGLEGKTLNI